MLATVVNIDKDGKRYAFPVKKVCFHVWKLNPIKYFFSFFRSLEAFLQIG